MRSGSPEFTRRIEFFTLRLDLRCSVFGLIGGSEHSDIE